MVYVFFGAKETYICLEYISSWYVLLDLLIKLIFCFQRDGQLLLTIFFCFEKIVL